MNNAFLSGYNPNPPPELASKPVVIAMPNDPTTESVMHAPNGIETLVAAVVTHVVGTTVEVSLEPYKALPRAKARANMTDKDATVSGPRFKPGVFVTWTSQAAGVSKAKTGKIIGIVPRLESIAKALETIGCTKESYSLRAQDTSIYDRYVIHVMKKRQQKNHIYAPNVSAIDACAEISVDETLPSFSELSGSV